MPIDDPFKLIEAVPPRFSTAAAETVCRERYGLKGRATPLVSERDQNFLIKGVDGRKFVLKIASALEDPEVTDFQVRALQHIARQGVVAPAIVLTQDGAARIVLENEASTHVARVVTYLDGRPLEEAQLDPALCRDFGHRLAELDAALADFSHPGETQTLLWDMQRALELKGLLVHVADDDTRGLLAETFDEFESRARPALATLRRQVIHNDANPGNVLGSADGQSIVGIIDFGDMLRSSLVVELAVACAYLRVPTGDPLRLIVQFVAGYQGVTPLTMAERRLLLTLIRTRLATTVIILAWRESLRGDDDAYLQAAGSAEQSALGFLERLSQLSAVSAAAFLDEISA